MTVVTDRDEVGALESWAGLLAAAAGRFDEPDLGSILDHLALNRHPSDLVRADETHSAQPGTSSWRRFGA